LAAIREAAGGVGRTARRRAEVELAELVRARMPAVEMLRASTPHRSDNGRDPLARAATGGWHRQFDGGLSRSRDAFLVKAGSGVATLACPTVRRAAGLAQLTLTAPFNDLASVAAVREPRGEIAA